MAKKSRLLECITKWCKENNITTFRAGDTPCLNKSKSFLSKHRNGNPGRYKEYFSRISTGLYKLIDC